MKVVVPEKHRAVVSHVRGSRPRRLQPPASGKGPLRLLGLCSPVIVGSAAPATYPVPERPPLPVNGFPSSGWTAQGAF